MDATRFVLGEGMPRSVQAAGGIYYLKGKITTPDTLTAHFEFERCPVVWRHRLWGAVEYSPEVSNGIFFFGDKATVFASDNRWIIIPPGKGEGRKVMDVKPAVEPGVLHMANFLEAVRTRKQPDCPPEDGFQSTAMVQLGMIAYNTKSLVNWDARSMQIVGNPAAAKLLKREYRAPYKHPWAG